MSFLDFFSSKKANETLAAAIHEQTTQLKSIARILEQGGQSDKLETSLVTTRDQVGQLNSALERLGVRPIPVQTFPVTDDFRFEKEKQKFVDETARRFVKLCNPIIDKLHSAHQPVNKAMEKFFSLIEERNTDSKKNALESALKELLDCSPKRVIAAFQKHSLEAGCEFVQLFNGVIDALAMEYPRCRSGIYASRLNYSDVIQISEEVLATLRATSTILDDVQRRHSLLEALAGELLGDLQSPEINEIWRAIGASFKDSIQLGSQDDHWLEKWFKTPVGVGMGAISWAVAVVSVPQAQFQGQLARQHRVKVFLATSLLLQQGWAEWSQTNKEIVVPNLRILFGLKCDFVRCRFLSIADLVSSNGYPLENLPVKIGSALMPRFKQ